MARKTPLKKSRQGSRRGIKKGRSKSTDPGKAPGTRMKISIMGAVQGVGFRPFIYNLANKLALKGWVLNSPEGVQIEVEGQRGILEKFLVGVQKDKPRLAFIQSLEWAYLDSIGFKDFKIKESRAAGRKLTYVLPDIATCDLCLRELSNPEDRRHEYPFTNCTLCGPRFSIIENLPYDRPNTLSTF